MWPRSIWGEQAGSHRAGDGALLLRPVPEPDDGGSRLGVEGSAREVVGGACLQQNHRPAIDPGVLWGDCGEEQSGVSPGCGQHRPYDHNPCPWRHLSPLHVHPLAGQDHPHPLIYSHCICCSCGLGGLAQKGGYLHGASYVHSLLCAPLPWGSQMRGSITATPEMDSLPPVPAGLNPSITLAGYFL